jgi:hypothetical protein
MTQKTINILTIIVTILQTAILSIPSLTIDHEAQKWLMVATAGAILIFNGALQNFRTINTMLVINIISFVGFVAGGLVDYLDAIPNLSEVAKTNILTVTTLLVSLSNILSKNLTSILGTQKNE